MNIPVITSQGRIYCRPDTTWDRENRDIYVPDFVSGYHMVPVVFARISRAGKAVGKKFAQRYWDSFGCGVLLYEAAAYSQGDLGGSSCLDHTSFLPHPLYNPVVTEGGGRFTLDVFGQRVFECGSESFRERLEDAIVACSERVSLRIGDFVCVELSEGMEIQKEKEGTLIEGSFCDNKILENRIIW